MVKDESSEVREAASLFRSALGKRDAAKVRSLCTRPERAHRTRGITNSITPVVQQAVDLLGERERSVRTRDVNEKGLVAFVESVSVEMKEYAADDHEWITAFVRDPASGEVLRLRKVGSKWLVDLGEG